MCLNYKTLFADHGLCGILVTDNGPSYVSQEFETSSKLLHQTYHQQSNMYPKSNGFAESMVKLMKFFITKSN